ncbi:exonuclease 1 [Silene latifolia]|uniref:exonuclease 1 n=1 Tax=Silene latifolia TaxID=37657 RepID=UPI003D782A17
MGIKDLLRFMKPYVEPIHIKKYAGKRVGIDAYSWLHKGAYSCSMELCLNSEGEKKYQYINYFMHRINLLRHHKITPVVIFDGGNIPCKAVTENDRYRHRKANREMAMEKLREGNINAASDLFQRAISITPAMAHQLIQVLRQENVELTVAPYEADAQLAYLSNLAESEGGIQAVISEDSDLLAYGCPSVIFKMDKFGNGEEIALDKVFSSTDLKPSFRNFNRVLFIEMCVLAGCDFLPSVPGIGIAKAHSLVSKYRNIDRVLSVLKCDKSKQVPEDYDRSFREAVAVFQHAKIYNKSKKRLEHLKELPEQLLETLGGNVDFLGPDIPPSLAIAIAEGNLDPTTMEAYDCFRSRQPYERSAVSQEAREGNVLGSMESESQVSKGKNYRLAKTVPAFKVDGGEGNLTGSCFTVYSSRKSKETTKSSTSTVVGEMKVSKKINFADEMAALTTLACPLDNHISKIFSVCEDTPLKTPDNNPFRKRKCISEDSESRDTPNNNPFRKSKRVSEDSESRDTPNNNPFRKSKGVSEDSESRDTPNNNPFRKSKGVSEDSENRNTPISGVTECDQQSELKCYILDSQESVSSKVNKLDDKSEKGVSVKKTKTKKCKGSNSTNGSGILSFFARK